MANPFSTNELLLRSDRIAFGKIPPEVPVNTERLLLLPDTTGQYLYIGLSTLVSTSAVTGTLEAIYPQFASFTFDNTNNRLGINNSSPQYTIDISTTSGIRIQGGTLVANASGLVSVPTAALFSTLPAYVFAPGSIPPTAIASTGSVIPGISVPTSALFSTLPTSLFAPSSIPLLALQSTGTLVASFLVGDGAGVSNIPLANINATITGNFFQPNTIPLSSLASTGQIWIRDGSLFAPYISTGQFQTSSLTARDISTSAFTASSINAQSFFTSLLTTTNISAISVQASSIRGEFFGNGLNISNINPANLNNVIPSNKFGYRTIAFDAINPFGDFQVIAGTAQFRQATAVTIQGFFNVSSIKGDGSQLTNIPYISSGNLVSTVAGLTFAFNSSIQFADLVSSIQGLGSAGYASTSFVGNAISSFSTAFGPGGVDMTMITSTIKGLGTSGYISSSQLLSTTAGILAESGGNLPSALTSTTIGLGSLQYISSAQLLSTTAGILAESGGNLPSALTSTTIGLGSLQYISSAQLLSTTGGLQSLLVSTTTGLIEIPELTSTTIGLGSLQYISSAQLLSTTGSLESLLVSTATGLIEIPELTSTTIGLGSLQYISSAQLLSTTAGILAETGGNLPSALTSTTIGLGSLQYISSAQLLSTTGGLQSALVSTATGLIEIGELTSSFIGLGSLEYISSSQLVSSVTGLTNTIGTFIDIPELTSTTIGLGSLQYISSAQLLSTTGSLESLLVSTTTGLIEIPELTSSLIGLGSLQYISSSQLLSTTAGILAETGGNLPSALTSTTIGLGTLQYISSAQLLSTTAGLEKYISSFIDPVELASSVLQFVSTGFFNNQITSTTIGLGTLQYISSAQLLSTTAGLEKYISSFIDPQELASSVLQFVSTGFFTNQMTSTTIGLGSLQYISSAQLLSTTAGLEKYISSFIDPQELASSVLQFVSTGFFSKQITSTTIGLGSLQYISSAQLVSTTAGILAETGGNLPSALTSTTIGLGSLQYISSAQLLSTTGGLQSALVSTATGLIDIPELRSTTIGLGTLQYISSAQLISTTAGLEKYISSFIDPQELASSVLQFVSTGFFTNQITSTTIGLGTLQYISTAQLVSTTAGILALTGGNLPTALISTTIGLGTLQYISSAQLVSTTAGLERYISSFIDPQELASSVLQFVSTGFFTNQMTSTTIGLGTLQYISSAQLLSTTGGLQSALVSTATGLIDIPELRSTTIGLGTLQYISSAQLLSTTAGLERYISSFIDPQELASSVLQFVSTGFFTNQMTSTTIGLGTLQYISSAQLVSTTAGILAQTGGNLPTALTSTTIGLGTLQYISSAQLLSTTSALLTGIRSTSIGLGTLGYISSTFLPSLNSAQIFTSSLFASTLTANSLSTGFVRLSTAIFNDALNYNSGNIVYVASTLLYFNSYPIGGSRVAQQQWVTF